MLRRYPYWGWLLLSIVLWSINIIHFHGHRQEMLPEEMARVINKDLVRRESAFENFLKDKDFIRRLFADSISDKEEQHINEQPFYIYGYDSSALVFWNNNSIIGSFADTLVGKTTLKVNQKGVFVKRCFSLPFLDSKKKLVVFFPIVISYPLQNDYLHSHFAASDYIPVKTKINPTPTGTADEYKITLHDNNTVGYLTFNPTDIQKWNPDALLIAMLIVAILTSISWIQLMAIHITRKRSPFLGFAIILAIILLLRGLLYKYGMPFNLDALTMFSPRLYASSIYLSSLGDLFINLFCVLWVVMFIIRHTAYKSYFVNLKNGGLRALLSIVLLAGLAAYAYLYISMVRSLVLDSSISFDVTHFYAISIYTVFGLLAIVAITAISATVAYLFNVQLSVLIRNRWLKYIAVAAACAAFVLINGDGHDFFYWMLAVSVVAFIILLDVRYLTLVSNVFEPHMIVWALIICGCSTGLIHYFNQVKEQLSRLAFVEQHLSPHRDDIMESSYDKTAKGIETDKLLKSFFYAPAAQQRKNIDQHFESQYLTGPLNKYEVKVFLFDEAGKGLFNKDTSDFQSLVNEKTESVITNSPYLFYKESVLDRHYYLSYIPVYSDTVNHVVGYVILDLDLKKSATETVYPELLQPVANKAATGDNEYAYAVYINGKLITQTNDYPFPVTLRYDTLKDQQYTFTKEGGAAQLFYKIADKRTVVVVHYHSEVIETVTLFSYLFGIQVTLAALILLYQLYLAYFTRKFLRGRFIRLTLRRRMHFSMLLVVFVSFAIIGYVTIAFFTSEYRSSNDNKLQAALQVAKQSVQDYLERNNAFDKDVIFDSVSKSPSFKYFLSNVANSQKIDINIFDDQGNLFATSQEEIYDKGLISRKIRPDAYFQLSKQGKSLVIQNEHVAGLSYNSAYQPLRDEHGVTLGYINVPFFSSEKDLDFQISNIVVTLINLYAFIFLVSSLITVIMTRWMTRTFDIIIRQFDKLNLERNDRIEWPYDDEIGKLVTEYNKMVKKVEENAARLAQSERETAWREMARQVAHEIKNPLTPMKLNIQYLQQAVKKDNPDIKQLTERVSNSIIEQIDNLSYIASEFSNFAKMPEAKPEELDVCELLSKALELYTNQNELTVSIQQPEEKLVVLSDRSQLLRVFTNLLENAKQAIPETKHGKIDVSVTREDGFAAIAIKDNGTGITEEVARRIFQPYFTTKSSGTGLGLAMTRKIIEFWKGDIRFETEEEKGTTFFIKLPAIDNDK